MMGFENTMGLQAHLMEPKQNTISNFRRVEVGVSTPESSDKMNGRRGESGEEETGLLWRLPVLKSKQLGKVGPAFGLGVGCGFGFGVGLIGGVGFGPGIHGLQFGYGFGAGCGIGLGFGYGVGRGIAQDQIRRYSNVGNLSHQNIPSQDDIVAIVDELVLNSKKFIRATSKEIDKWRR